jgi:hypothetical protein
MSTSPRNLEYEMARRGRERRLALGLSVNDVSARMKRKPTWVYRLEVDGAATLWTVRRWAEALEMHPGELAFGKCG